MDIEETRYYREKDGNILKLDIMTDPDPMNPRRDWDNIGTMVCYHTRYDLGDCKSTREGPSTIIPHTDVRYDCSSDGAEAFVEWAQEALKQGTIVLASLELYDHSGITMRVCDWNEEAFGRGRTGWDSGIVGWIFITKEQAGKEFILKDGETWQERARKAIEGEVETYDNYLRGDVYGYNLARLSAYTVVENGVETVRFSSDAEWQDIDNCWGYYGDDHDANGLTECIPEGAEPIRECDLPEAAKEAA